MFALSQGAFAQQFETPKLSVQKEAALGTQLAAELRAHSNPVANQAVQDYVQGVGRSLSRHASGPFPWTFEVVTGLAEYPAEQLVAIPGGYVFCRLSVCWMRAMKMSWRR